MSIKLGSSEISAIYLGDTEIQAVYLGDELIFGSWSIVAGPFDADDVVEAFTLNNPQNATFRTSIPADIVSAGGSKIRMTLDSLAGSPLAVDAAYVGHQAISGDAYDFDGNQVQLTVGGNGSFTVDGATLTDEVAFGLDESRVLLLALQVTTEATVDDLPVIGASGAFIRSKFALDAATTDAIGYSLADIAQGFLLVTQVEAR